MPAAVDRVVVQVGGGALAACTGWGLGAGVRLDAVQTEGCAPLARGVGAGGGARTPSRPPARWGELMTPWPDPHSAADGILDDETYDWLGVLDVVRRSGGQVVVVARGRRSCEAHELGRTTGIPVSATGTAGLAALLTPSRRPAPGERVAVIFSAAVDTRRPVA